MPIIDDSEADDLQMPNLGAWLRRIRVDQRLSRAQTAQRVAISETYVKQIENGYRPTREVLECFIKAFEMSYPQARHTRELWGPPAYLPPIDELRSRINTPGRIEALAHMDKIGMLCVYTDPLWNVLSANESFYSALPGLDTAGNNIAVWFFCIHRNSRPAMSVTLEWDHEAHFHVGMLRGPFGLYRTSPRAQELFDHLRQDRDFRRFWNNDIHVAYARQPNEFAHLRDPATGEPYSISIDIAEFAGTRDIRVCQAFRQPLIGPATPLNV
ncbi:helix-turn-helix domain-containing protein [Nocardia sp. NPDC056000]|uniref:helix-turn-helix domain-containing protein n=1 Tax=Nocardia sp. NPDC056000 TaxID=3345674 RepID=UPI0035E1DF70